MPAILIPVAIVLAALAIVLLVARHLIVAAITLAALALFFAHHPHRCRHCPLCCQSHPLPDTLVAVSIAFAALTIALFVACRPHCRRPYK